MSYKKWTPPEPVVRVPMTFDYPPSKEQADMFDYLRFDDGNLHGEAGAGTGKSTTAIRSICMEKRKIKIAMAAFNSSIVKDIEPRTPSHVTVKTFHAFGFKSFIQRFGKPKLPDKKKGETGKSEGILCDLLDWINPDNLRGSKKGDMESVLSSTERLISLMKLTLTNERDLEGIQSLIDRFGLEFFVGEHPKREDFSIQIIPELPRIFDRIREETSVIDFDDMMWLPIQYDLNIDKFDMLYCDEWQDANALMMEYARRMSEGGRVMTIGDRYQSIYGFAGADTKSIDKSIEQFNSHQLPLMTCYRCGHDIVAEVNKIMPDLRAYEKNPQGEVRHHYNPEDFKVEDVPDGGMILCRRNAGLVRPCFQLLKKGRKAMIKGKDIGYSLLSLVDQLNRGADGSMVKFMDNVEVYRAEKINAIMKRSKPSPSAIEYVEDQTDAIKALSEGKGNVMELKTTISNLFSDYKTPGVTLSSMHKSKGLEADHVVIVQGDRMRINNEKMTKEDHDQERNLEYVAKTRAKKLLEIVYG